MTEKTLPIPRKYWKYARPYDREREVKWRMQILEALIKLPVRENDEDA